MGCWQTIASDVIGCRSWEPKRQPSTTKPMSTPRSISSPTISRSTSIATGCWRSPKKSKAEQDSQHAELHGAGGAIDLERSADVGRAGGDTALAHPFAAHLLTAIGARTHQPYAERACHRRLRPAGVGRVVLARVAPGDDQRLPRQGAAHEQR